MIRRDVLAVCCGLFAMAAASAIAQTAPSRVVGKITAVSGSTVTIAPAGGAPTTITIPTTARIWLDTSSSLSALTTGEFIRISGPTAPASVSATGIMVFQVDPKIGKNGGVGPRTAEGTITSISPLTIKTASGAPLTVTTTAKTKFRAQNQGTVSNIVVGDRLQASFGKDGAVSEVHLSRPAPPPAPQGGAAPAG